jgi:hypothetical protein
LPPGGLRRILEAPGSSEVVDEVPMTQPEAREERVTEGEPGAPAPSGPDPTRALIAAAVLAASAVLLFARLGHYALWDDEALTALHALGVWRTGDTTAVIGHNIVGYRSGALLEGLRERFTPPLPSYLAAPFLGLMGPTALAARLPFAACGLACVALILAWLCRLRAGRLAWALMAMALLGNVSFFLYARQCRYYGVAILASVALAYLYLHHDGRRRTLAAFALLSVVLLAASNYMQYAAFYAGLAVDFAVWGRRHLRLRPADWLWVWAPQLALGVPIVLTWNPLGKPAVDYQPAHWWAEKATLFWWNLRDMNRCEFGAGLFLLLAPALYVRRRQAWLLRAPLLLLVYDATVTLLSPQPVGLADHADVRYLAPVIPLWMALAVLVLLAVERECAWTALPLGVLAFGTNTLHGGPPTPQAPRSSLVAFVGELIRPPDDPYTVTAAWINAHVPTGTSVWVLHDYMTYPLMFHAPGPIYAWQFRSPPAARYKHLAPIHFEGKVPPDVIIAFGPFALARVRNLKPPDETIHYRHVHTIDHYWKDKYRPELFWRSSAPITHYDRNTEAIFIFRRSMP